MGCRRFIPREKASTTKSHNVLSVLHLDMRRRGQEIGKRQTRWPGKGPDSIVQNSAGGRWHTSRRAMSCYWANRTQLA